MHISTLKVKEITIVNDKKKHVTKKNIKRYNFMSRAALSAC